MRSCSKTYLLTNSTGKMIFQWGSSIQHPFSNIYAKLTTKMLSTTKIMQKKTYVGTVIVDDIILFNANKRQLTLLYKYISNIHKNLKFTRQVEANNFNFLYLIFTKTNQDNYKLKNLQTTYYNSLLSSITSPTVNIIQSCCIYQHDIQVN